MINRKEIWEHYFIRSIDFEEIFEQFFISAVVAILGIRIFLTLTNFPQLSNGNLHIAHMVWGGILMLISIILLFTFLSGPTRSAAAILGGLGFGTSIDEVGKYITSDNNYFYQPAFSIIYIVFVLLYLAYYMVGKYVKFSSKEYLINSIEYIKYAVTKDLDEEEKEEALRYLSRADENEKIAKSIHRLYQELDANPNEKPSYFTRIKTKLRNFYFNLVKKTWFSRGVITFFVIEFVISSILILTSFIALYILLSDGVLTSQEISSNRILLMDLLANTMVGIFIIWGVLKMHHSRIEAYQMFKKAMLVSIFLVQVFSFYQNQLNAVAGLLFNVIIFNTLNYMIKNERILHHKLNISSD